MEQFIGGVFSFHACSLVSDSVTPWTAAIQVSLSIDFSRQEYWSGLPLPILGYAPNPGVELASPVEPESKGKK